MSMVTELETLKLIVMDRKSIDLTDRIYLRGLINDLIKEAHEAEEGIEIPEWAVKKMEILP